MSESCALTRRLSCCSQDLPGGRGGGPAVVRVVPGVRGKADGCGVLPGLPVERVPL